MDYIYTEIQVFLAVSLLCRYFFWFNLYSFLILSSKGVYFYLSFNLLIFVKLTATFLIFFHLWAFILLKE